MKGEMYKTLVILKSKDGRRRTMEFDTYEEAVNWISENCGKHNIKLELDTAIFDREPTIEIYKEKP